MEKKGVYFARKFILAVGVFFLLLILPAVNAEAKEVSLVKGDAIRYMGYSTHYYYVDGNLAFCLEPDMKSPENGAYSASELDPKSHLSKAMYYMYGGPGYEQYIKSSLTGGWGEDANAYCLTHCVLSYIYDGCDQNSAAFKGLNADIASAVVMYADYVKNLPDIPDAELAFSENGLTTYYDREQKCQRTQSIRLVGDTANSITVPLPDGVMLVNETRGTSGSGNVKVSGGDTFYLRADVTYGNGTTWSSGEIRGEIAKSWKILLVKTGNGSQDIGTASMQQIVSSPIELQVKWLDKPELQVEKNADKSGKTYKLGDIITYTLDVTQQIETPSMEMLSTLMGKYGEEGDKLLFKIQNSGDYFSGLTDEELLSRNAPRLACKFCEKGLRYDLTVPFARYVVMHRDEITFPFKRYQIQPVWRADRPQKGRYREFYQCDADVVGSDSLLNEVELMQIVDTVFTRFGIRVCIKINNRKVLSGIAEIIGESDKIVDITVAIE